MAPVNGDPTITKSDMDNIYCEHVKTVSHIEIYRSICKTLPGVEILVANGTTETLSENYLDIIIEFYPHYNILLGYLSSVLKL